MSTPEKTYVTFTLPEGLEAPAGLEALGATLGKDGGRVFATLAVELGARSIEALRTEVEALVKPDKEYVRMAVWPTPDLSTPLHEQLDQLRQPSHAAVSIGYYVVGAGWGRCVLATRGQATTLACSYLEDALGDLVDLGRQALGDAEGRCSFMLEPGEYRWVFAAGRLRVLWFTELYGCQPDHDGEQVFEVACSAEELARAILRCAVEVEQRYGEANYEFLWHEHPYPRDGVDELRRRLGDADTR